MTLLYFTLPAGTPVANRLKMRPVYSFVCVWDHKFAAEPLINCWARKNNNSGRRSAVETNWRILINRFKMCVWRGPLNLVRLPVCAHCKQGSWMAFDSLS